jgi:hypothetical protein
MNSWCREQIDEPRAKTLRAAAVAAAVDEGILLAGLATGERDWPLALHQLAD